MNKTQELAKAHLPLKTELEPLLEQLKEIAESEEKRLEKRFKNGFVLAAMGIWQDEEGGEECIGGNNLIAGSASTMLYLLTEVISVMAISAAKKSGKDEHEELHEILEMVGSASHLPRDQRIRLILETA